MNGMFLAEPPDLIKLLAHELRWNLVKALIPGDFRVQELVQFVGQPLNLVSYHLKHLRQHQLVTVRRSDADGRDMYYSLDLNRLQMLYRAAGEALHPALVNHEALQPIADAAPMRVLFLCTQNSARSQMAEGILRAATGKSMQVVSAGNQPSEIHPLAVQVMAQMGIDISSQKSRSIDAFVGQSFDYVITVCDRMREVCPTFPGEAIQLHWSLPDPAQVAKEDERVLAFEQTAKQLTSRITYFLMLIEKTVA